MKTCNEHWHSRYAIPQVAVFGESSVYNRYVWTKKRDKWNLGSDQNNGDYKRKDKVTQKLKFALSRVVFLVS